MAFELVAIVEIHLCTHRDEIGAECIGDFDIHDHGDLQRRAHVNDTINRRGLARTAGDPAFVDEDRERLADQLVPLGSGANITNINANNISSGILPIVRGGTGSSTLTADIITQGINNRFIINNKISLANQQDLRVATNILPDENDKYSLGSSHLRWKDIFVSANTITIGEAKLSSSPTGALETNSVSFADRINLITSNELNTLSGITIALK